MITVTASESQSFSVLSQLVDSVLSDSYKWFSLQDNILDGSYHPIDTSGTYQIGWWGKTLSDANGAFSTYPTLTLTFDAITTIHALRLYGDDKLNCYPVNFDVYFYDDSNNLIHTENITENSAVAWEKLITTYYNCKKLVIEITKINKANESVKLIESVSVDKLVRVDNIKIKIADIHTSLKNNLVRTDILKPKIVDAHNSLKNSFIRPDSLLLKVIDSHFFTHYEMRRYDTLLPKIVDNHSYFKNSFVRTDTLKPKIVDTKSITCTTRRYDILLLHNDIEAKDIEVSFTMYDDIITALKESSGMTNVYTRMKEDLRQIFAKVQITYSDPFIDNTISLDEIPSAHGTSVEQVVDNIEEPSNKFFALFNNKLDGSYHPIDVKNPTTGWWSTVLSNADGSFTSSPQITIHFSPRTIYTLKVIGDLIANSYPIDFQIDAYDVNNTNLYSLHITNNAAYKWTQDIAPIYNVTKLTLTINKINQAYQPVKIMEFFTYVVETYDSDTLVNLTLLQEIDYDKNTVRLGTISANEVDLTLLNIDKKFDVTNKQSTVYGLLKKNRKIQIWLGVEVIPGQIEWAPFGVYWTTLWHVPDDSLIAQVTARDILDLMSLTDFINSQLYVNKSLGFLFETILQDYGLTTADYIIDTDLYNIIIPYVWFPICSHRDALQRLASCALVYIYCNRQGQVIVSKMKTINEYPLCTLDNNSTIYSRDYPLRTSDITNYVEVSYNSLHLNDASTIFSQDTPIILNVGQTLSVRCQYNQLPVTNVQQPVITKDTDISVQDITQYGWGTEIVFCNNGTTTEQISSISITGQVLQKNSDMTVYAKDDVSIRDEGKIKASISSDFIQDAVYAQSLANEILADCETSRDNITLQDRGNLGIDLMNKINIKDPNTQQDIPYLLIKQTLKWDGALQAQLECKKL